MPSGRSSGASTATISNGSSSRFRQADRRWLIASRERLIALADARRPQKGQSSAKTSRLGQLEAEVRRKRGLKPVRKLFSQLGDVVQVLKPCFMMSPMSAAQYLEPGKLSFDLVIFDEASQVEPADALGAIARGRQVILVGDEKQLPPTNFFGVVNDADAEDEPDDDTINTGDLESVLAMGQVCLPAKTTLRWHYRSRHSSLIEFSNEAFYDRQLRVFPSPADQPRAALACRSAMFPTASIFVARGNTTPSKREPWPRP